MGRLAIGGEFVKRRTMEQDSALAVIFVIIMGIASIAWALLAK